MPATAAISAARRSTSSSPRSKRRAREGIAVEGPFPSDTVFVRARNGDFDAVLTMYHDQGQIAMKLMGFDRGVTLMGGFPFPICTPAHGTAYEIAGKGIANIGATRAALLLAAKMAAAKPRNGNPTALRPQLKRARNARRNVNLEESPMTEQQSSREQLAVAARRALPLCWRRARRRHGSRPSRSSSS